MSHSQYGRPPCRKSASAFVQNLPSVVKRVLTHAGKVKTRIVYPVNTHLATAGRYSRSKTSLVVQGWHLDEKDIWIGATDAAAFLRFLGFETVLINFVSSDAIRARQQATETLRLLQDAVSKGRTAEAQALKGTLHTLWMNTGCASSARWADPSVTC
jgi:hypothetical protein